MVVRCLQCAVAVTCAAGFVAVAACGSNGPVTYDTPLDASAFVDQANLGSGVSQPCDDAHACRAGLACNGGKCAPAHVSGDGVPCVISAECKQGDYCGPDRTCAPAGAGATGDACKSDADCGSGLRCDFVGFTAVCKPEGASDLGGACATSADCFGGLACANKTCVPLPATPGGVPPLGLPTWTGADCTDDPGPTKAYFRVPRGTGDGDFYRLPFPNDVRLKNGHPDLSGHPTPGSELLGFDLVDRYLRDVEQNTDGFSAYPTVTVRFSASVDFTSLEAAGALTWIELGAAGTGTPIGFGWSATTGRNQYLCPNSVVARVVQGGPLKPGATYAFVVSKAVHDATGKEIAVDDDMKAMLDTTAPTDPALAAAWPKYKPLRDWATANGGTANVLDATVFTVAHADAMAPKLVAAVAAAAPPTVGTWVKCGGATPSPCPQATGDRACGAQDPAFDELHTLASIPIFQKGTEPYLTPDQGGDIGTDGSGTPQVQHTEQVCLALTVPKGTSPAAGWPLVLYAHGTGGSFRSHVIDGAAAMLAAAKDDAGNAVPMAVLGIDQVAHGTRRGASTDSPNNLFYNFANPLAARGNPLQGAADQASLARLVQGLSVPASVTGSVVKFSSVAFWGHSQGATEGGIALGYTTGVSGAVLSGEGASLLDALLTKRSPVDIADVLPLALGEKAVDVYHPVLTILQNALDAADPLNHAATLAVRPPKGMAPKSVFQPYGLSDSYAPGVTQATFALVAGLGLANAPSSVAKPDPIGGLQGVAVPVSGNVTVASKTVTAIVREYSPGAPATYDGHFVAYKDANARADVSVFLADVSAGKTPKVGAP